MISAYSTNSFENTPIHYIRAYIHVFQSTGKDMVVHSTAHSELTEVNHERTVRESDLGLIMLTNVSPLWEMDMPTLLQNSK